MFGQLLVYVVRFLARFQFSQQFIFPAALLLGTLFSTHADARWLKAESPLFVVYSEGSEQELHDFTQKLEDYDALLRIMTGTTAAHSPNKFSIYLVRDNEQLQEVAPRISTSIAGFYQATPSFTSAFAIREDMGDADWLSAQSIILHEYTHHFVLQYYPANYPEWFSEGIAEYFAASKFKPNSIEVGKYQKARVYPLRTGDWVSVERIFKPTQRVLTSGMFYPESWLITHYLMDDDARRKQLFAFLQALGRGEKMDHAFTASFGMSLGDFNKAVKAYLKKGQILVRTVPRETTSAPEINITSMPESADALLLMSARLMTTPIFKTADAHLVNDVRKRTDAFPDDALAQRTLAHANIIVGDYAAADSLLDKVIARDPKDVEALYLKSLRFIVAGHRDPEQRAHLWAEAKPYVGEIYKLDPNHYPSLYFYGLASLANSDSPSENTLNVLKLAHQLAPQVDDITLETAVALSNASKPEEARHLLEMVAYEPHATARSTYARRLLDRMASGEPIKHTPGELPDALQ